MFRRTMMRLGWPATAALTAVVVSLPAFAAADYSSHAAKAKRPAKAKALRGPRGLRGIQGPQGRAGTAGINGVGASGPAGAKGDKGEKGDQRTKVFNIAMAVGDADVTVLAYAPFTVVARCSATGPTVNADLLIKTITDDVYLDAPDGQPAPDFDTAPEFRTLSHVANAAATATSHSTGGWAAGSPQGAAIAGEGSIGTNVYAQPGVAAKSCLFLGSITTS